MHAAATPMPCPRQARNCALARTTSGRASAASSLGGVLAFSAGTTTQSGRATSPAGRTAMDSPSAVRMRRPTPATVTSNGAGASDCMDASSLAVSKVSSSAVRPVSNTPSSASRQMRMS